MAFSARRDGGCEAFEKVLYNDEYTSANDVRIDPSHPNTVYASLWIQQQGFYENGAFGGAGGGIYKSTDGGNTWRQLTNGLPPIIEANLAIAPSNPKLIYATIASPGGGDPGAGGRRGGGTLSIYKSTDGGEHWIAGR